MYFLVVISFWLLLLRFVFVITTGSFLYNNGACLFYGFIVQSFLLEEKIKLSFCESFLRVVIKRKEKKVVFIRRD